MKLPPFTLSTFVACAALAILVAKADAETIYTWNNTGTNFSSAGSWTPGGSPTSTDIIQFTPGGSPYPTTTTQPTIDADMTVKTVILAPTPDFGGWTFSGGSTLTVNYPGGVNAYGPATFRFDGPAIQGLGAINQLFNITNGSTVVLQGNSSVPANAGTFALHGGTLVLDNSTNNSSNRLPLSAAFNFQSGTLELRRQHVRPNELQPRAVDNQRRRVLRFQHDPAWFPAGVGNCRSTSNNSWSNFTTLFATTTTFRFEATAGVLGGPGSNDPKVTFTGSPGRVRRERTVRGGGKFDIRQRDRFGRQRDRLRYLDRERGSGGAGRAELTSANATGTGHFIRNGQRSRLLHAWFGQSVRYWRRSPTVRCGLHQPRPAVLSRWGRTTCRNGGLDA